MKKLISLMLALIMVFSLATVASAATEKVDQLTFTKEYTVTGGDTTPSETISFDVTEDPTNPETNKKIVINSVNITGVSNNVVITLPEYAKVGVYKYTVTEIAGTSQGVTYATTPFDVHVLVAYNDDQTGFETEIVFATKDGEGKIESFTNLYDLGSLAVSKNVTGNLGDQSKAFDVKVTFTAESGLTVNSAISYTDDGVNKTIEAGWTGSKDVTITLKHDETVTFTDIPAGVTYTVVEDSKYSDDTNKNGENGYDAPAYDFSDSTKAIAQGDEDTVEITNNKENTVSTGIVTDSAPYIILIAVCAVAAVAFVLKRRNAVEF